MKTDALTRLTLLTMFLALVLLAAPAHGDWVEEWLSGSVTSYTGPSYIEAGRRGYLSFGSVSTRTLMTTDRLVTFTPPSINFGCGGIDLFLGGFSFLDFDYLVDKFQRIISAAPAFAFDYALRAICEQCGTIKDSLEHIQDLLNMLQLSDCQASRALGYWMASLGDSQYAAMRESLKPALAKLDILEGRVKSWKEWIDEKLKNPPQPGKLPSSEYQKLNQNCPSYLISLLNTGSLVHYVRETYFPALDASFEAMVRGYLGDVVFYQSNGMWMATLVPSCGSKNTSHPLEALVSGTALVNASPGSGTAGCTEYSTAYPSAKPLREIVQEKLASAYTKALSGSDLSPDETQLLVLLPSPVYHYLKQLYVYDAPETAVLSISDTAAYGLAYTLLAMVYAEVEKALTGINEYIVERCEAEKPPEGECILCDSASLLRKRLKDFRLQVMAALEWVQKDWKTQLAQFNQEVSTTLALLRAIDDAVRGKIGRREPPAKER